MHVVIAAATSAWAAPGDLDATFGTGGIVRTELNSVEEAHTLALQTDGKLVAAGSKLIPTAAPEIPPLPDVAVVRYNTDGTLDGTFGTGGAVITPNGGYSYEDAVSMEIRADGKIVVGGLTTLERYETDGTLDTTFSGDGIASGRVTALVVQSDGKVVFTAPTGSSPFDFTLRRYNDDGSVDLGFGTNGVVTTDLGTDTDAPEAMLQQPDGKLVVGGWAGSNDFEFALVRYDADGNLDPTFGSGGIVLGPDSPVYDRMFALTLQPDGKIVGAGSFSGTFALVRYEADGTLDTTFGVGGIVTTAVAGQTGTAEAVVALPSGKLMATGPWGPAGTIAVVAYNPDGSRDPLFGDGGIVTTTLPGGVVVNAAVLQPDKKLVIAGAATQGNDDFLLARYEGPSDTIAIPSPSATPATPTPGLTPTPTVTETPFCTGVPASGCRKPFPGKSQITIKDNPLDDRKDKLLWKWFDGPSATLQEFGDPTFLTKINLCVYDYIGGVPSLILALSTPCTPDGCWRTVGEGWKYRATTKDAPPDGVSLVLLKPGIGFTGHAKIKLKAQGMRLATPALPLAQSTKVTVQLVNNEGKCWDADYAAPAILSSSAQFRDKND
jgi:uncharacterized delta-60 repeat protein